MLGELPGRHLLCPDSTAIADVQRSCAHPGHGDCFADFDFLLAARRLRGEDLPERNRLPDYHDADAVLYQPAARDGATHAAHRQVLCTFDDSVRVLGCHFSDCSGLCAIAARLCRAVVVEEVDGWSAGEVADAVAFAGRPECCAEGWRGDAREF